MFRKVKGQPPKIKKRSKKTEDIVQGHRKMQGQSGKDKELKIFCKVMGRGKDNLAKVRKVKKLKIFCKVMGRGKDNLQR